MLVSEKKGDCLCIYLRGEIDHCMAASLRPEIEALIRQPSVRRLNLDFAQVSFMDSSGVGMILGRYRTMRQKGGSVSASGLHPPVDRLFHLAGLHRVITVSTGGQKQHG